MLSLTPSGHFFDPDQHDSDWLEWLWELDAWSFPDLVGSLADACSRPDLEPGQKTGTWVQFQSVEALTLARNEHENQPGAWSEARKGWWHEAACASPAPSPFAGPINSSPSSDPWFPERGDTQSVIYAKTFCNSCPVRVYCLVDGLREQHGVWGGFTVEERELIRRSLRKARLDGSFSLALMLSSHRAIEGGWCIDCGVDCEDEEVRMGRCPESGSARFDPYMRGNRKRLPQ